MERAFRLIDADGNGSIEKNELSDSIEKAGLPMDMSLFDIIDKDSSGEIDTGEFEEFWTKSFLGGNNRKESLRFLGDRLQEHLISITKPLVENNVKVVHQPGGLQIALDTYQGTRGLSRR